MKRFQTGFVYLVVAAGLVLALSAPASSTNVSIAHATLLESIQQQIHEILAAIKRIQARLEELAVEAAKTPVAPPEELTGVGEVAVATSSPSTGLVWKFFPTPTAYLSSPLTILYRFSVTGGTADAIIPSVIFTYAVGDVSLKDLEVYAFSDDMFSVQAFLRNATTKKNRVGRQIGYLDSQSKTVTILFDQGPPSVTIPAGVTYYFELRGTVVGKNVGASFTVSAEGLSEVVFN